MKFREIKVTELVTAENTKNPAISLFKSCGFITHKLYAIADASSKFFYTHSVRRCFAESTASHPEPAKDLKDSSLTLGMTTRFGNAFYSNLTPL